MIQTYIKMCLFVILGLFVTTQAYAGNVAQWDVLSPAYFPFVNSSLGKNIRIELARSKVLDNNIVLGIRVEPKKPDEEGYTPHALDHGKPPNLFMSLARVSINGEPMMNVSFTTRSDSLFYAVIPDLPINSIGVEVTMNSGVSDNILINLLQTGMPGELTWGKGLSSEARSFPPYENRLKAHCSTTHDDDYVSDIALYALPGSLMAINNEVLLTHVNILSSIKAVGIYSYTRVFLSENITYSDVKYKTICSTKKKMNWVSYPVGFFGQKHPSEF